MIKPDKIISSEPTLIGPKEANALLEMFAYPRQRHLKPSVVANYVDLLRRGEFYSASQLLVVYAPDDNGKVRGYLINGQHRLHAIIEADMQMIFLITNIEVDTMAEVDARYVAEDAHAVRTTRDIGVALNWSEKYLISNWDAQQLDAAVTFIRNDFRPAGAKRVSPYQRDTEIGVYAPAMRVFLSMIQGGQHELVKQIRRAPSLAVALVTIREARQVYGHQTLHDFWGGIVCDDGLGRRDPRKVAVRHLNELSAQKRGGRMIHRPEYTARVIASCYNGYIEGREMQFVRPDTRGPIVILGSAWSRANAKQK